MDHGKFFTASVEIVEINQKKEWSKDLPLWDASCDCFQFGGCVVLLSVLLTVSESSSGFPVIP